MMDSDDDDIYPEHEEGVNENHARGEVKMEDAEDDGEEEGEEVEEEEEDDSDVRGARVNLSHTGDGELTVCASMTMSTSS